MSDDIKKRDITSLIEKEAPNLHNLLDPQDVNIFKEMTGELRDTWTKKQMFRTQTEMEFSVLNDAKYPTNAAKYWQCVREQNVFLENLMSLSFEYRRNEVKIKRLEKKLNDDYNKVENQPIINKDGSQSENGKFIDAWRMYQKGEREPAVIKVYRKIEKGVWVNLGFYQLIGVFKDSKSKRTVYKFNLRPFDFDLQPLECSDYASKNCFSMLYLSVSSSPQD